MVEKNNIPPFILSQLGYLTKDVNLYHLIDQTNLGKSIIGKEMDLSGRYILNHRIGGGHLWWKELGNRPLDQWGDVIKHLASDLPTRQGLPYAFDYTHVNDNNLVENLGLKELSSSNNWGMLNAFDLIAGSISITFAAFEFIGKHELYTNDMALATDWVFVALNIGSGIATCNPLLIIGAIIKTGTIIKRITSSTFSSIDIHPGPFDVDGTDLLNLPKGIDIDLNELLGIKNLEIFW
jgi:hypothetical protein